MILRRYGHIQKLAVVAAILAGFGLAGYLIPKERAPTREVAGAISGRKPPARTNHPAVTFTDYQSPATNVPEGSVLRINPDAVLASINGRVLTAATVLPPGSSNRDISSEACEYFRQRAVDRELIFQTAKAQGVELDESQYEQLAKFKMLRGQGEPGVVRDLNGGAEQLSFDLRDAEAFMLQTSLMDRLGVSPNVTSQQVLDYYQQHASEFGELPAGGQERQAAWEAIDFKIRQELALSVRSEFQNQLIAYMNQIKSRADVQLTPLLSFAHAR